MWWFILILIALVVIVSKSFPKTGELVFQKQEGGTLSQPYQKDQRPLQIPSLIPVETMAPHCQYPFELVNRQCQLQCPTDHFMASNPTIRCQ